MGLIRVIAKKLLSENMYHKLGNGKRKSLALMGIREKDTISVIIPTYRANPYIHEAVRSVLSQNGQKFFSVEVLVCVNGGNEDYAGSLINEFAKYPEVKVCCTKEKGAAAGRNMGIRLMSGSYAAFLDDDDFFTDGYLLELWGEMRGGVDVVCSRLVDLDQSTNQIEADTYINRHLQNVGHSVSDDYVVNATLFSGVCAKLYRAAFLAKCSPFDSAVANTEDVAFWCDNIHLLKKRFVLCDPSSSQAYVRRKTPDSRSRPAKESEYGFYISDRIAIIERLSERVLRQVPFRAKKFVLKKIEAQTNIMYDFFQGLDAENQQKARKEIAASAAPFLNKSKFGEKVGIAFCHNFSPYVDASAFAATKRLSQISSLFGALVSWNVVAATMHSKKKDTAFDLFFARFQYSSIMRLGKRAYFAEVSQRKWGMKACKAVNNLKADVIYSRSLWAGSHVAALNYKRKHPGVVWYAEFSDPLFMGADNRPRPISREYEGDEACLNTFYRDLEYAVMKNADHLIYTNENQEEYMLRSNPLLSERELVDVRSRSIVMRHTALAPEYALIKPPSYPLDEKKINIGYFGTFYKNRSSSSMLNLLDNPQVELHIFCPKGDVGLDVELDSRVHVNKTVSHLSFLNLASRMDYLYLNDVDFEGPINPFVPSKLADYLSTGSQVIAEVNPGSVMCQMDDENLIKVECVDAAFALCLQKQK